jgi:transcription initiation factor IIF auxiliary subunit
MTIKLVLDSIDEITREINTNMTTFNTNLHNFSEDFMKNLQQLDNDIKININKLDNDIKTNINKLNFI